jgi:cell wall-associated NlpC family hydrolase
VPSFARTRRTLMPLLLSLFLLGGLALTGPAATAAPSRQASAANGQADHAARKHKHRKHKHKHRKRHHKKRHHHATQPAATGGNSSRIERAATIALQQLGDPYRYGGDGPSSFDCSGLMQYSFGKAGIKIPRTAAAQAGRAHHIARSQLRRGDTLYFTSGGHVYHTAMFLKWSHGSVQMLHAPGSGDHVRIAKPWTNSWFAGTFR